MIKIKKIFIVFTIVCLALSLCCCSKEDTIKYSFSRIDRFKTSDGDIVVKEKDDDAFYHSFDELVALYCNAIIREINDTNRKDNIEEPTFWYEDIETQVESAQSGTCDTKTKLIVLEMSLGVYEVRYAVAQYNADKSDENFEYIIQSIDRAYKVYCSYVEQPES